MKRKEERNITRSKHIQYVYIISEFIKWKWFQSTVEWLSFFKCFYSAASADAAAAVVDAYSAVLSCIADEQLLSKLNFTSSFPAQKSNVWLQFIFLLKYLKIQEEKKEDWFLI